jgi:hypothetical protein
LRMVAGLAQFPLRIAGAAVKAAYGAVPG